MRWFVEISPLGTKSGEVTSLCVEAPQWQPALQKARALRGDNGALSNFSIELLEDGFRAIDPVVRLRYIVRRAPEDAPLTDDQASKREPFQAEAPKTEAPKAEALPIDPPKKRAPALTMAFTSQGAAAIVDAANTETANGAASAPPEPVPVAPPPEPVSVAAPEPVSVAPPEPARNGVGAHVESSEARSDRNGAASRDGAVDDAAGGDFPAFVVVSSRVENPSDASPLTYREYVYAVDPSTPEKDAHRLILDRFESVCEAFDPMRVGRLVNLAIFDHVFQGRPLRRPLVTLTWKDWKSEEPEIRFPLREAGVEAPASLWPRPSAAPSAAPIAEEVKLKAPPAARVPAEAVAERAGGDGESPIPTGEEARAEAEAVKPATVAPTSSPSAPTSSSAAPTSAAPTTSPSAQMSSSAPPTPSPSAPTSSSPAPTSVPAAPTSSPSKAKVPSKPPPAKKRHSGEDLLTELFEASGDLHFARDALEGAEFVLELTLEKLPSEVGMVSLFDMNKREFVVVRQLGGPRLVLCARQPEKAPLALSAMRRRRAIAVADVEEAARALDDRWRAMGVELKSLIVAPVELSGRYLGLIEVANPVDGKPYTESDSHALTFVGQQYAEFVAARGVIVDEEHIRGEVEKPPPPRASSRRR